MEGYSVTVVECSKELTAKERIKIKDISDAIKLDSAVDPESTLEIVPDITATLKVHNEKSDNKDYNVFVIIDKDGKKYITGSESFKQSYKDIEKEMDGETEAWAISVYKIESKNYKGRYFITCSII